MTTETATPKTVHVDSKASSDGTYVHGTGALKADGVTGNEGKFFKLPHAWAVTDNRDICLLFPRHQISVGTKGAMVPMALLSIAAPLKEEGYNVQLLDGNIMSGDVEKDVETMLSEVKSPPLALGISSMTGYQIWYGLKFARAFRKKFPESPIVWGGMHATLLADQTLRHACVDYVVVGPGEWTFMDFIHALESNEKFLRYEQIPGLGFKRDGKATVNADRKITKMDMVPSSPYELIDVEAYVKDLWYINTRTISYISSQGCPFRCTFCTDVIMNKKRWSGLSSIRMLEEIEGLVEKYRVNGILFYDNNFFVNKQRVLDFCKGVVEAGWDLKWFAVGRAPQLNKYTDEDWALMVRSGLTRVSCGAESGDQTVLDLLKKDADVQDTIDFVRRCKKFGVQAEPSFMVGLPENYEQDFAKTVDLIDWIFKEDPNSLCILYYYTPYPKSELQEYVKTFGFTEPDSLEGWGDYMLREPHGPWLPDDYVERVKMVMMQVIPFTHFRDIRKAYQNGWRRRLTYQVLHRISKYRWEKRYFGARWEYRFRTWYQTMRKRSQRQNRPDQALGLCS